MTRDVFEPEHLPMELCEALRSDKHPHKSHFIERIQGKPVERMPYWEVNIEARILANVLERPFPMGAKSYQLEPEELLELARRVGLSGVGMGIFYSPCRKGKQLQTRKGFEEVQRNGPPEFSGQLDRLRRMVKAAAGTGIGVWAYTHGPFDPVYLGMDLENFWLLTMDDPKYLYEVADCLLDVNVDLAKKIIDCGVDWIHIADDVSFKSGLMVKPDFFFDFYPSRLRRILKPAQDARIPVTFHSDGKVDMIIDLLVDAGVQAINPVEPYSNDIREIAELADGRIGIIGNLELARLSPEEVYRNTRELIETLGDRYVPASSHSVTNDVSPEVFVAFLKAVHGFD